MITVNDISDLPYYIVIISEYGDVNIGKTTLCPESNTHVHKSKHSALDYAIRALETRMDILEESIRELNTHYG